MNCKTVNEAYITNLVDEIISGTYIAQTTITRPKKAIITISKNYEITEYFTYQQKGGNICGFYALFNVVNFVMYLKTNDEEYLKKMNSVWEFWSFHYNTIHYLLKNLKIEPPGVKSLLTGGPLERYQFNFLLQHNKEIATAISSDNKYNITFSRFFYGFGRVNGLGKTDVKNFQKEINTFLNFDGEKNMKFRKNLCIVLLGITNHWNILLVERNFSNLLKPNKYYFLDSRNYPEIFGMINDESKKQNFIENCIKKSIMFSGKEPSSWWVHCLPYWIEDMNKVMVILKQIFDGTTTLCDIFMNQNIDLLLKSFEEKTSIQLDDGAIKLDNNEIVDKIEQWFKGEYHPKVLSVDIDEPLQFFDYSTKLDKINNYPKFYHWIEQMELFLLYITEKKKDKEENKDLIEIIQRYNEIIKKLKIIMNM